jgi:hypothetical protein
MFIAALVTIAKIGKKSRFSQQMNAYRKVGMYTQQVIIQPLRGMKSGLMEWLK